MEIASAHVGAHSVSRIVVHLVWATGGRRPVIDVSLDEPLEPLLRQKASEQRAAFYAFGAACDHVHVLAQLDPMLGVATLVNRMKGASSHALRRRLVEGWQAGSWAESVSPDLVATTSRFVRGQRAHHASEGLAEPWEMEPVDRRARDRRVAVMPRTSEGVSKLGAPVLPRP